MTARPMRETERAVVIKLLEADERLLARTREGLEGASVEEMSDGSMRSFAFVSDVGRQGGTRHVVAAGEFADIDGTTVSIALLADARGELAELDVWKVDFSPLKRWPSPEEITLNTPRR